MVVVLIKHKVFAVTTKLGFVAMNDPEFDQEYPWGMGEICEQKREHKNFKLRSLALKFQLPTIVAGAGGNSWI